MKRYLILLAGLVLFSSCSSKVGGHAGDTSDTPLAPPVSSPQVGATPEVVPENNYKRNSKYPDPSSLDMKNISSKPWSPPSEEKAEETK